MKLFSLFGEILLKDDGVSTKINDVDNKAKGASGSFDKLKSNVLKFAASAISIGAIVKGVEDVTKAAQEQERADNRLWTLMKNVKGTTEEQIAGLKQYAGQLQNIGVIGDEVAEAGMSQLATFNLQSTSVKKLLPSLEDLAVSVYGVNVSQEQMISMGNLVGKAMQGQVGALTRYGVTLTDAQQKLIANGTEEQRVAAITEALQANFGGLNESARKTSEGGVQALKNSWGDMKEVIGAKLIPVLNQFVQNIMENMPKIQDVIMKAITAAVGIFKDFGDIIKFVEDNSNLLIPVIVGMTAAITALKIINTVNGLMKAWKASTFAQTLAQEGLNIALKDNPIGLVVTAIGLLVAAGVLLYKNWDVVKSKTIQVFGAIRDFVKPVIDSISGAFHGLINGVISGINGMIRALDNLKFNVPDWVPFLGGKSFSLNIPQIPAFAKGTDWFSGGLALVGEQGPELVNLPRGSQVVNNDDTRKMLGGNQTIYVTINANDLQQMSDLIRLFDRLQQFYRAK